MAKDSKMQTLSGRRQQLLYSPKGGLEGFLMTFGDDGSVQVSMAPASADVAALSQALGRKIEVTAEPDHSPKTKDGAHTVFRLAAITKVAGKVFKTNGDGYDHAKGVVTSIHYAKHGEPNGVILDSGEFIHTRPHGMKNLRLHVGSKVVAHGERRMTILGTGLIEAREVNSVPIA
jgi:hypothetical protein